MTRAEAPNEYAAMMAGVIAHMADMDAAAAAHKPATERRCLICGASAPAVIEEGKGAPCGH